MRQGQKVELGLLFPPNSDVHYKTIEFEYTVHTNNLGFRGEDVGLARTKKTRVMALGDSFTYGWGVNLADTWIKRVESALTAAGHDVEILNFGVPGAWPGFYADRAEELVPVIKPDLILVGLLQGDDLRQCSDPEALSGMGTGASTPAENGGRSGTSLPLARRLFPNLTDASTRELRALSGRLEDKTIERWASVANTWKQQVESFLATKNQEDMKLFQLLPAKLKRGFLDGELNPTNLRIVFSPAKSETESLQGAPKTEAQTRSNAEQGQAPAAVDPPVFPELDLGSELMRRRIEFCTQQLERIRKIAEKSGARVVVVSIPESDYVVLSGWKRDFRKDAPPEKPIEWAANLVTTVPDEAVRRACEGAGVPLIEMLAAFREKAKGVEAYYPYDTHFTPEGNRIFAELLTPLLNPYLD